MRVLAAAVALLLGFTACTPRADQDETDGSGRSVTLAPYFPPLPDPEETPGPRSETAEPDGQTPQPEPGEPEEPSPATEPPEAEEEILRATITDPHGDVTPTTERSPEYADLRGATLTRSGTGYELRVRTDGEVPDRNPEGRTMNVAAFFDVSGDGQIDYEIWVNLADNGWGPGYFDNRNRTGGYMDDSGVDVTPEGDELIMVFPLEHLDSADSFRWAIASEWGRYEVISTPAAARDSTPDDGPADFPSPR